MTSSEVKQKAQAWFEAEVHRLSVIHGHRWPELQAWVQAYLREQIRGRLIELGWKVKR